MSLISLRKVQGGGYGGGHSDLVISLAENDVSTCLSSTLPFTIVSNGQKTERQQEGKWALLVILPLRTTMHPWGPLPVYLFQDCHLNSERVEGVWKRWLHGNFSFSRVLKEHEESWRRLLAYLSSIMQNMFKRKKKHRRKTHALKCIEHYKHGSMNSTS